MNAPLQQSITKSIQPHSTIIDERFVTVTPELQSINAHRYARQITGGIQEWMEAMIFRHYLEKQQLLTFDEAASALSAFATSQTLDDSAAPSPSYLILTPEDYVLGIFDATGEMMRFAITTMATSGALPVVDADEMVDDNDAKPAARRTVLQDLQTLRTLLVTLAAKSDFDWHMRKDVNGKLEVMLTSVEKVERALYGLVVRGSERPKGWMPDLNESRGPIEAEG